MRTAYQVITVAAKSSAEWAASESSASEPESTPTTALAIVSPPEAAIEVSATRSFSRCMSCVRLQHNRLAVGGSRAGERVENADVGQQLIGRKAIGRTALERRIVVLVETGPIPAPEAKTKGERTMRFMVIVKATKDSEAGKMPSEEMLAAMAKFNEEMVKAGIMLDGDGLQSSSKGARIRFSGDKRTVIDGPFAETKELVAGYWIIQVKSKAEAIEWMKRCPNPHERGRRDRDPPDLRAGGFRRQRTRSSTTASSANRWPRNSALRVTHTGGSDRQPPNRHRGCGRQWPKRPVGHALKAKPSGDQQCAS